MKVWQAALPAAALAAFLAIGLWLIETTPFPAPDELQHVSFAAFLRESGRWLGAYERQMTLSADDLRQWTDCPNYIGHPSPYYLLIGAFIDRALPPWEAVLAPRLVSLLLPLVGLAASLWVGRRRFEDDFYTLAVFCGGLMLCPELLSTVKQVNNDALGIAGGGLAYAAVAGRRPGLGGVGLMLALWAKPNAGLAVGVFLAVSVLLTGWRSVGWRALASIALGALLGGAVYVPIVLRYGAVVPVAAEMLGVVQHGAGYADYVPLFFLNVGEDWGYPWAYPWGPAAPWLGWLTAMVFWPLLAMIGWGAWRRRSVPAAAGLAAMLLVLPVHFGFAAAKLGFSIPAASFRYYLPLWPALADGVACAVAAAPRGCAKPAAAAAAGAVFGLGWWA